MKHHLLVVHCRPTRRSRVEGQYFLGVITCGCQTGSHVVGEEHAGYVERDACCEA